MSGNIRSPSLKQENTLAALKELKREKKSIKTTFWAGIRTGPLGDNIVDLGTAAPVLEDSKILAQQRANRYPNMTKAFPLTHYSRFVAEEITEKEEKP